MKRMLTLLLLLCAASVQAGTIVDIQTGVYAEGVHVDVEMAVVTGVLYNGFFMSEQVNGPYAGIWVYDGGANAVIVGDIVNVGGLYEEYWDLSEINVGADAAGYVTVLGNAQCCSALTVTIAQLNEAIALGTDAYESCYITVVDGMMVTQILSYGMWEVESYDTVGEYLLMDDYWYDDTTVLVGDCYFCATGIYTYNYSEWKLNPMADGIQFIDCSVSNEDMTFGDVKNLYR